MNNSIQLLKLVSYFAIAFAIVYFAFQLSRIVDNLPVIEQSLSHASQHVTPALKEVEQVRLEVAKVRKQIPHVLDTANRAIESVNNTEAKITSLLPQVLTEVRLTREKIDPTLNKVDILIDKAHIKVDDAITKAQGAGKKASEGAVTGILSGILKLPFKLIGTLASPILSNIEPDIADQLTQKDIELMGEAGNRAAKSKKLEQAFPWQNTESGNSGAITLIKRFEFDNENCVKVKLNFTMHDSDTVDKVESYCRNNDGYWKISQNSHD